MSYNDIIISDRPFIYWPLTDVINTTARDLSGSARNGTYENTPTKSAQLWAPTVGRGVKTVLASSNDVFRTGFTTPQVNCSFEIWLKADALDASRRMIAGATGYWGLWVNNTNFSIFDWSVGLFFDSGSHFGFNTNSVFHVAFNFDSQPGSNSRLYLNGNHVWTIDTGPAVLASTVLRVAAEDFGGSPTAFLSGELSGFAVYNYQLSRSQILNHYNAGKNLYQGGHSRRFR